MLQAGAPLTWLSGCRGLDLSYTYSGSWGHQRLLANGESFVTQLCFLQVAVLALSGRAGGHVPFQFRLPALAYSARPFASAGAAALLLLIQNLLANACGKAGCIHLPRSECRLLGGGGKPVSGRQLLTGSTLVADHPC